MIASDVDMTNCTYGAWRIVGPTAMKNSGAFAWLGECRACGATKTIRRFEIYAGKRQKCDTCRVLNSRERSPYRKLARVWGGMHERCYGVTHRYYKDYGGRGIRICQEWMKYEPFLEWSLANGYRLGLTIDRIDNDGDYSPDNCRWVTRTVNANNTRKNRFVSAFGDRKTLSEWARDSRCVVAYKCLHDRIVRLGWNAERALTKPGRITSRGRV